MRITTSSRVALPLLSLTLLHPRRSTRADSRPPRSPPDTAARRRDASRLSRSSRPSPGRWQGHFINPETKKPVTMEIAIRVTSHGNSRRARDEGRRRSGPVDEKDHPRHHDVHRRRQASPHPLLRRRQPPAHDSAASPPTASRSTSTSSTSPGPTTHGHMQHVRFTARRQHASPRGVDLGPAERQDDQRRRWTSIASRPSPPSPRSETESNNVDREWNDGLPIYRQLRDRVVAMILDGVLKRGRSAAVGAPGRGRLPDQSDSRCSKAYQELVDEGLVEKRRGLGMFVTAGARARC